MRVRGIRIACYAVALGVASLVGESRLAAEPPAPAKDATPATAKAAAPAKPDPVAGWRGVKVMPKQGCKVLAVGGKAIADKHLSFPYVVQDVKGKWLWVGEGKKGWVLRSQVLTIDEAAAYYTDWIKRDPLCLDAYHLRVNVWILKAELDLAMVDAEELLRLKPDARAFGIRASVWCAKEQFDEALADLTEAIRLDPSDDWHYVTRGNLWAQKDENDKAIADYDEAIRLNPNLAFAYQRRGISRCMKHEYARAIADFNESLRLDPNDIDTYAAAAELRSACPDDRYHDSEKAIQLATKGCELSEWKNATQIEQLARIYGRMGDYEQTFKYLGMALKLSPNDERLRTLKRQLEQHLTKKPDRYAVN